MPFSVADTPYSRHSPLDIPEILERIFSTLDRKSILHLVRCVCRQWHHISRRFHSHPLVYSDTTCEPGNFDNILKRLPYAGSFHWRPPSPLAETHQWLSLRDVLNSMGMEKILHRTSDSMEPDSLLEPIRQPLRELCLLGAALPETVNVLVPHLRSLTTLRLDHFGFHEVKVEVVLRSCPLLESLFLSQVRLMAIDRNSPPLSTLDLSLGAQGPLLPSRGENFLRLKVLKVIISQVHLSRIVDILAVCPKLVEFAFVANFLNSTRCNPAVARSISQEEFVSFLGLACRRLRMIHYSVVEKRLDPDLAEALLRGNPTVTEWSFMPKDLDPFLGIQLCHQNVITSLEIADFRKYRCPVHEGFDMMQKALHQFLCNAPLLRRLKMNRVNCVTDCLDPFPLDLQAKPRRRSSTEDKVESPQEPRVWACRNLHSLTLRFTQSHSIRDPRKFVARDIRVLFGYLSRVCPKLCHVDIGLDNHPLDLQSGLCLITRLKHLETLTIEMQSKSRRWPSGPDLSWMDLQASTLSTFRQRWNMKNWSFLVRKEQGLIQRRLAYLDEWRGSVQGHQVERPEDDRAEFASSFALLGTLTDVSNCMNDISRSRETPVLLRSRFAPRVVITRGPVKTCAIDALSP